MNRAKSKGTGDKPATGWAEQVAALEVRVKLLELAVVDYAERYGLTDLARTAMVRRQPPTGPKIQK
jgi:hypothetical protein